MKKALLTLTAFLFSASAFSQEYVDIDTIVGGQYEDVTRTVVSDSKTSNLDSLFILGGTVEDQVITVANDGTTSNLDSFLILGVDKFAVGYNDELQDTVVTNGLNPVVIAAAVPMAEPVEEVIMTPVSFDPIVAPVVEPVYHGENG